MSQQLNNIIILIHGFNKNKKDMYFLENKLKETGHKVLNIDLPATFGTMEECRNSLHNQIKNVIKTHKKISYISHSMGGLIIRDYINHFKQKNINKCIFIATPHKGSKLAEIVNFIPFYSKIFKPIKILLPSNNVNLLKLNKNIQIGLIAGNKDNSIFGKLFLKNQNDGSVEVSSARTDETNNIIILNFGHKEIHKKNITFEYINNFLLNGNF
ncbi:MAG: alpha/beta hydrolase [Bacteroidota bacterium]|nr:alpha/beta hydrolase [Bacteroidota bacterium]